MRAIRGQRIARALASQHGELSVSTAARLIGCTEQRVWEAVEHYNAEQTITRPGAQSHQIIPTGDRLRLETPEEWGARSRLVAAADDWASEEAS